MALPMDHAIGLFEHIVDRIHVSRICDFRFISFNSGHVCRHTKMGSGEPDVAVFGVFWTTFKKEFLKSNMIGFIYFLLGLILLLDLKYFSSQQGLIFQANTIAILTLSAGYMVSALYVFPVFVHYEAKMLQHIKNSILIAVALPARTIGMGVGCLGLIFTIHYFPKLLLFFSGSLLSLLIMKSAYLSFERVEQLKSRPKRDLEKRLDQRTVLPN